MTTPKPHESRVDVYEPARAPQPETPPEPEFVDLTKLSKAQLQAHAEREGIDLAGTSTRQQMIDRIAEAPLPPVAGNTWPTVWEGAGQGEQLEAGGDG